METERLLAGFIQLAPVSASRFQQRVSANDIGFDKISRAGNGAIHMALGGQMHHRIRFMGGKDPIQLCTIADIHLFEGVTVARCDLGQRFQIARVGKLIKVDHRILRIPDDMANNSRTDKTGSTGYKDFHKRFLLFY